MFSGLPVVMGLDLVMSHRIFMDVIPIFACPISKKVMPIAMPVPKDLQNGENARLPHPCPPCV